MKNLVEMFYYGQKAVLHSFEPLFGVGQIIPIQIAPKVLFACNRIRLAWYYDQCTTMNICAMSSCTKLHRQAGKQTLHEVVHGQVLQHNSYCQQRKHSKKAYSTIYALLADKVQDLSRENLLALSPSFFV